MSIRDDLISAIAFVLRRNAPWRRRGSSWYLNDDREPERLAEQIVDHLDQSRFEVSRKPPEPWHKTPGE